MIIPLATQQRLFGVLRGNGHARLGQSRLSLTAPHGSHIAQVTARVGFQGPNLRHVLRGDQSFDLAHHSGPSDPDLAARLEEARQVIEIHIICAEINEGVDGCDDVKNPGANGSERASA